MQTINDARRRAAIADKLQPSWTHKKFGIRTTITVRYWEIHSYLLLVIEMDATSGVKEEEILFNVNCG